MREIKYQAFLHDEKISVAVVAINLVDKFIQYYDVSLFESGADAYEFISNNPPNADCPFEKCSLREYTGLKDKHGREIYEGDILRYENLMNDTTEYGVVEYTTFAEWSVGMWLLSKIFHRVEVVGNVHENPELLEVEE